MAKEDKKKTRVLIILTVIAIASLSFFLYISYAPSSKAKSFEECTLLYNSKKYDACITCLSEYIKANPESEAYRMRGMAYFNTEQYESAVKDFTEFLNKNKTNRTIYYQRGLAYEKLGSIKEAEADFKRACDFGFDKACNHIATTLAGPSLSEGGTENRTANDWFKIATDFVAKGDYENAVSFFNRTIELEPNMSEAYLYRGLAYRNMQKYKEALADYNKLLSIEPNSAPAYNNRGVVYWKQGKHKEALADYNKTISLAPNDYIVYNNRGVVYYEMGNYDSALADYSKAISLNPKFAQSYWNRAVSYLKINKKEDARKDFKSACDLKIDDACTAMETQ
jgi:tetratricopeptide (TPR) repeat protein